MADKQMLHKIVDNLNDRNIDIVFNPMLPYVDEEEPTEDDIIAIEEGRKEFLMGETVSHDDVNWD